MARIARPSEASRLALADTPQGTLTPIVKVPSHAIPTDRTRKAIAAISADPKNIVYLISGRDGDFLMEHWGDVEGLGLSAEHGRDRAGTDPSAP